MLSLPKLMAKKQQQVSFEDVLGVLGTHKFDVAPAPEGAKGPARAMQVSKYGCAAVLAPTPEGKIEVLTRGGYVLGGAISRILDRGYQKFLTTGKLTVPATAEHLRSVHQFSEELKEATGATELYNEAMGTTSDVYVYDRVKGRVTR